MEHRNEPTSSPGRSGKASPALGARGLPLAPQALKRKLTLLQLIDELSALREDEGMHTYGSFAMEERREKDLFVEAEDYEEPGLKEGAEAFHRFDRQITTLDQGLQAFQTSARQLGSSVGLLASASQLRHRLHAVQALFHENAATIFPGVKSKVLDIDQNKPKTKKSRTADRRQRSNSKALFLRPVFTGAPDPETLPDELATLARDVKSFLEHLEEFPEFVDEALNASITAFESDLRYRADCLSEYEDQFRWPSVQRYVHAISTEMTIHLQTITQALKDYVDNGVPAIRFAQKHNGDNLLNLSTIATFFSGVTATTAQYSYATTDRPIDKMVNLLFFGSLVLSISAAINSLLGLTWKRAMYRSPRHRVPWWVLIWIKRSPLVLMVASVALFSAGLVCFCYSSQHLLVSVFVLVLTCFCTFGLVAVSSWFVAERWTYSKHNGLRWLSDILEDHWRSFIKYPPIHFLRRIPRQIGKFFSRIKRRMSCFAHGSESDSTLEDGLPFSGTWLEGKDPMSPSPVNYRHPKVSGSLEKGLGVAVAESVNTTTTLAAPTARKASVDDTAPTPVTVRSPRRLFSLATSVASSASPVSDEPPTPSLVAVTMAAEAATTSSGGVGVGAATAAAVANSKSNTPGTLKLTGANRFRQIGWKVAASQMASTATTPGTGPAPTQATRSQTMLTDPKKKREGRDGTSGGSSQKPGRLTAIRQRLKNLQVTHTLFDHNALVRHLQFSPNGKLLATCGWDGTARLFEVPQNATEPVGKHKILAASGFLGQVAWSRDGKWLLVKWTTGIQVWGEDGVRRKRISRGRHVRSVAWLPSGGAFLSVEDDCVVEIDLDGKVLHTHSLDRLALQDVAVTDDDERMLGVAILRETKGGLQPSMSRVEKRVVVYNLKEKKIENLVPVLDDVRDITISQKGAFALVSSENKGPPQLFRMDNVNGSIRLAPYRTYLPKTDVDFAGPSYFAGPQDEFILVPTKSGDILFWDRESGVLLHALRNKDVGDGDLTSVAWNYASKKYMLASASHDGSVRIWISTVPDTRTRIPLREQESSYAVAPVLFEADRGLSASPTPHSRRPTATSEGHTYSERLSYGRPSIDSSVEAGSTDFNHGLREMRRVDSPLPGDLSIVERINDPNASFLKGI